LKRATLVAILAGGAALLRPPVAAGSLPLTHPTGNAPRIETISPACAAAGEAVVITGERLGPRDLHVTVGGLPAKVTASDPHRAAFVVPAGIPLGPTTVVAARTRRRGDPDRDEMPFQLCELAMPDGWTGRWGITLTYRDPATSDIVAVDRVTTAIRPGEPLGLSAVGSVATCSGAATGDHTEASCEADLALDPCRVQAAVQVAIDRDGAALSGAGSATTTVGGLCPASSGVSAVEVEGVRLDTDPGPDAPGTSLLEQIVHSPGVRFARTLAFASLTVESLRVARLTFRARGGFDLAAPSDGIDPVAERVGIRIGSFVTTLPARSFVPDPHRPNEVSFDGTTPEGVKLTVTMRRQRAPDRFVFAVRGEGLDVGGTANPLLVSILIGDDAGTARVRPAPSE
jgi:hypothetical protein